MTVVKPNSYNKEHADFLASIAKESPSNKATKLAKKFVLDLAEATVMVLYWEKNRV